MSNQNYVRHDDDNNPVAPQPQSTAGEVLPNANTNPFLNFDGDYEPRDENNNIRTPGTYQRYDDDGNPVTPGTYQRYDDDGNPVTPAAYQRHDDNNNPI